MFTIFSGTSATNQDPGAPMSVNIPPYSNPTGTIVYDFGDPSINWRLYHYGKIYYFEYKVFDNIGNLIDEGYLKHKFYDDAHDHTDINMLDPQWQYVADVPDLLPTHDVVVMYHDFWHEMCLTNRNKAATPLPSSVPITDPATSITYTLEFTSNTSGIFVTFN